MPIDFETLNTLRMLGTSTGSDFLNRIIGLYLPSTKKLIDDLKIASNNGDLELLTRAAHSMKASSGNIGAFHLMALCEELEKNCRLNFLDDTGRLVESISKEFIRVREYLEKETLKNRSPRGNQEF